VRITNLADGDAVDHRRRKERATRRGLESDAGGLDRDDAKGETNRLTALGQATSVDDLRIVLAVAAHGSFATAARRTRLPSSTVSRAVARLEEALGVRLFHRTSRHVSLTEEGARLAERATPLLDELANTIAEVKDQATEPSGRLRVTAPIVIGATYIAPALFSFADAHPRVSVELSLSNAVIDLVAEGFDLAFRGGPVRDPEVVARRLWSVDYAIGAALPLVRRELAGRTRVARTDLEKLPAIVPRQDASWRFRRNDAAIAEVQPRSRFCVDDLRVAIEAARRGLGIVRAPRELIERANLLELEPDEELGTMEPRDLYAVYPSRRFLPRRVRLAIDWVARSRSMVGS
jgi:DNA-binding transcriptional LysR family regulator